MTPNTNDQPPDLVRSAERAHAGVVREEAGRVVARKVVRTEPVEESVPRKVEHADLERLPVAEGDSGEVETLPDGGISIPVFEEQVVVTKRLVVRERVVLRKRTVVEEADVRTDLRREDVVVETSGDVRPVEQR